MRNGFQAGIKKSAAKVQNIEPERLDAIQDTSRSERHLMQLRAFEGNAAGLPNL